MVHASDTGTLFGINPWRRSLFLQNIEFGGVTESILISVAVNEGLVKPARTKLADYNGDSIWMKTSLCQKATTHRMMAFGFHFDKG
jgi:hypothetical protein